MLPNFVRHGEVPSKEWANSVVSSLRSLLIKAPERNKKSLYVGGGSGSTPCAFGSVTTSSASGSFIRGGVVYVGDKNFNVPNYEIDVDHTGTKLIYFEIECEVNRDDDNQILLPAVKTSTWDKEWKDTSSADYPNNTPPVIDTGLGKIIVPIASVTTASHSLSTISFVGCGAITVSHCGGTLSHSRG